MNQSEFKAKHATRVKRGKTRVNQVTVWFGFPSDWLKKKRDV